jgi:ATP-binding cassette subfamily B protein
MILVLEQGRLAACGPHEELLRTSPHYRRIFSRYDVALPSLETSGDDGRRVEVKPTATDSVVGRQPSTA